MLSSPRQRAEYDDCGGEKGQKKLRSGGEGNWVRGKKGLKRRDSSVHESGSGEAGNGEVVSRFREKERRTGRGGRQVGKGRPYEKGGGSASPLGSEGGEGSLRERLIGKERDSREKKAHSVKGKTVTPKGKLRYGRMSEASLQRKVREEA